MCKVEKTTVPFASFDVWGITNGHYWFYYCYQTKKEADKALENAREFKADGLEKNNICHNQPKVIARIDSVNPNPAVTGENIR